MNPLTGLCNSGWIYDSLFNDSRNNPTVWLGVADYENHAWIHAYMHMLDFYNSSYLKINHRTTVELMHFGVSECVSNSCLNKPFSSTLLGPVVLWMSKVWPYWNKNFFWDLCLGSKIYVDGSPHISPMTDNWLLFTSIGSNLSGYRWYNIGSSHRTMMNSALLLLLILMVCLPMIPWFTLALFLRNL